jgi:hypothetical protein
MLTRGEHPAVEANSPVVVAIEDDELRAAARRRVQRVHRLKLNVIAWGVGTVVLTTFWVVAEWQANGAFERLGHEGNQGDWNPMLLVLPVGIWGLVVGIMGLGVYFSRRLVDADVDRELERLKPHAWAAGLADAELRQFAATRLKQIRRLKFHVSAWLLGMAVLTPIWALIEWQDNGAFRRWSDNGHPGDWEPTIVYAGAIWAFVIAILALRIFLERPVTEAEIDRQVERLRSTH